jgi:hypothetical protein
MTELAADLRREIESAAPRLRGLSEAQVTTDRGAGKWVKKEILGHLADSAANNVQRFVRSAAADPLSWPGYDQNAWVTVNQYRDRPWTEVVDLWVALNRQVAHLIASVPAERLDTRIVVGGNDPVTLEWLMRDYVGHTRHHLAQILS